MAGDSWQVKLEGAKLPKALVEIEWEEVDKTQSVGEDEFNNEWRKSPEKGGYVLWTTLASEDRDSVHIPVSLHTDKDFVVSWVEVEAFSSHGPSHGRPEYLSLKKSEKDQVEEFFKEIFGF
jgi:hypothetical protein